MAGVASVAKRRRLRLAVVLAIGAIVASCGASGERLPLATGPLPLGASPSSAPLLRPSPTANVPEVMLDGAPMVTCRLGSVEALCGSLSVPEDRARPDGRRIDLRVAVVLATASQPAPDPVFMLAGGPGAAATDAMWWTVNTFRETHATRDIVLVDQRGTGGSNAMWLDPAPDVTGLTSDEADDVVRTWVDQQLAGLDADLRFYTTSVAMDDLDEVRAALGYDRINLYGASYGATAAQYYIRQHGSHLRSVVLDGATLIDVPVFEQIAVSSQRSLDLLLDRCEADLACSAAYPDIRHDLQNVSAKLRAGPVRTGVVNPTDGKPVVMTTDLFSGALHAALLSADTSSNVPWLIHKAAEARWDVVASAVLAGSGGRPSGPLPAMSAEIRCSEGWAAFDPADVERLGDGSYYVDAQVAIARQQAAACRYAPRGVVPANDAEPARSDVPVLLLVGEADPQDPPANVADASDELSGSRTVIVPGHGHTVAHLGCLPDVIDDFFESGDSRRVDASCVSRGGVPLPPFRLP